MKKLLGFLTLLIISNNNIWSSEQPTQANTQEEKECSICLANIDDTTQITTSCNHTFHKLCLQHWFTETIADNKCPMCKQSITTPLINPTPTIIVQPAPTIMQTIPTITTNLFAAISNNDIEGVRQLLATGIDINTQQYDSIFPPHYRTNALMAATRLGRYTIAQLLINAGADPNLQDRNGRTALIEAASNNRTQIAQLLINSGANIDWQTRVNALHTSTTALIIAAQEDYIDMVRILIAAGANLDKKNSNGNTALLETIRWANNPNIVRILIAAGANLNVQVRRSGHTALIVAALHSRERIVQQLVIAGANTTLKDSEHKTALDRAIEHHLRPSTLKILRNGPTPLDRIKNTVLSMLGR